MSALSDRPDFPPRPSRSNGFLTDVAARVLRSHLHWTGRSLVDAALPADEQARRLFEAPFAVLVHDAAEEPVFTYGNRTALDLFELSWEELTRLPSRRSAEPVHRAERARLLRRVAEHGYIDDYSGIRVSRTGRRFRIERATVWNVLDAEAAPCGQAAAFDAWTYLD